MKNLLQRKMFASVSFLVLILVLAVTSQVIFDDDDQQFQPPRQPQRPPNFGSSFQQNTNRPQFQGQSQQFPQSPPPPNPQTTSGFPRQERPFNQQQFDCQTFRDTDGFCTSINKCSFLSVILNSRPRGRANWILRRSICGFSGFLPMVCCPASRSQGNFDNENSLGNDNGFVSPSSFSQQPSPTSNSPFQPINGNSNPPPVSSTPPPPPPPTPPPSPPTQSLSSTKSPFEINGPVTLVPPKPKPTSNSVISTNPIPAITTPTLGFSGEGLPADCGTTSGSQNRVVGGREASKGAWPWIAAIGYRDGTGNIDYLCGGALISKDFVVTASHCIRDDLTTVRLGDHDLFSDADGTKPINIDVVQKIKHPNYNPSTFQNDIAIIKLNKSVDFTNQIRAICLPSTPQLKNSRFENTTPYVAGWGAIQFNGATSQTLRQVQLPIVDDNVCQEKYKPFKTAHVDNTNICAGYSDGGKDACQGDSGGPLMMPVMNGNKYVLIGVVSFGFRCAEPGFPGVYSRVTSQLDWIESVINQK